MPTKINPYKMPEDLPKGGIEITMNITGHTVFFSGQLNNEDIVFVTRRGAIATFKSIHACRDFITKFFPDCKVKVAICE